MRLAYCTGIRRWPSWMKTTAAVIATSSTGTARRVPIGSCIQVWMPGTRPEMIDAMISSDMPLPMPRWVISSPSHMIRAVPAVIVMTMITTFRGV